MTGDLLNAQEGGKMEPVDKPELGGLAINPTHGTISMKIQLIKDDAENTLPSYLIPKLNCTKSGSSTTLSAGSQVVVTLSGDNLNQTNTQTFTCEMTSNFLTEKDKSAITIETYYEPDKVNTIYFDDSLLRYYNNETPSKLIESPNPFLQTIALSSVKDGQYVFTFDFHEIIEKIKKLPSYEQIQNMFMFVNGIDASTSPPSKWLIKILEGGLKLNFKGVPFNGKLENKDLKLKIDTIQPETKDCTFDPVLANIKLPEYLKPVFTLDYDISCSEIFSKQQALTTAAEEAATKTAASGPSQSSIDLYNSALKAHHDALQNNDSNQIAITQAALTHALKKPGMGEYLKKQKASVNAVAPGQVEIHSAYDAKIAIANNNAADADHSAEFNTLKDKLRNPHVQKHFGLGATTTPAAAAATAAPNIIIKGASSNTKMGDTTQSSNNARTGEGQCGNGGISMQSRDGLFIFEVPHDMIISGIDPNIRAAMAREVLEKGAGNSNAAISASMDPTAMKPLSAEAGGVVVVDESTKAALQAANNGLGTANQKFTNAKGKLAGISPQPVIDASAVDTALAGANSAITAANSAITAANNAVGAVATPQTLETAKQRVKDATAAVLAVTNAVQKFSDAVNAAVDAAAAPVVPVVVTAATLDDADKAALKAAKDGLAAENEKLKNAGSLPEPDALKKLKIAIVEAEKAETAFTNATEATKATALNDAKTKIGLLTGLVTAATAAVDAAIVAALTDKLKKEATDVLKKAEDDYAKITSSPSPGVNFSLVQPAIDKAKLAIATISSAAAADKAALIATAAAEVAAAKTAADAVSKAVTAASNKLPPDFKEYQKAYADYDAAKGDSKAALEAAQKLYNDSVATGSGDGSKPTQIDIAKAALQKDIDRVNSDMSMLTNIQSEKAILSDDAFSILAPGEKTKEVEGLENNKSTYDTKTITINAAVKTYESAINTGDASSPAAAAAVSGTGSTSNMDELDGGSKQSSSKHKSTPKSKSKNKTKKNHSKSNPNPSKNKTPKIKMNE